MSAAWPWGRSLPIRSPESGPAARRRLSTCLISPAVAILAMVDSFPAASASQTSCYPKTHLRKKRFPANNCNNYVTKRSLVCSPLQLFLISCLYLGSRSGHTVTPLSPSTLVNWPCTSFAWPWPAKGYVTFFSGIFKSCWNSLPAAYDSYTLAQSHTFSHPLFLVTKWAAGIHYFSWNKSCLRLRMLN